MTSDQRTYLKICIIVQAADTEDLFQRYGRSIMRNDKIKESGNSILANRTS